MRSLLIVAAAVLASGCGDRVTGPGMPAGGTPAASTTAAGETVQGCVATGTCTLDPIVVDGSGQPGYTGGGGGGGGEAGTPPKPGDGECMAAGAGNLDFVAGCRAGEDPPPEQSPEPSLADDMVRDTIPPDCAAPDLSHWQRLYCFRAAPPDSAQVRATLQALDRIAMRGEECAQVAREGRALLLSGRITFFVWQQGDTGGYGHRNTGIQLDEALARLHGTPGSIFEEVLVHEIDHVLGLGHLDSFSLETPHSARCG